MSKKTILKTLIVFTVIIASIITGTLALTIGNSTSVLDLIDATRSDDWYDFKPSETMGKKIEVEATNSKQGGYCIDPETSIRKGNKYEIVNVIDVNNTNNTVKVYSIENPEGTEYSLSDDRVKPILMLSYLTKKADENPTDLSIFGYKDTLNRIFKTRSWVEKLKEVGLSSSFQTAEFDDSYLSAQAIKNKLQDAERYANSMASQGAIETAALSVNMTQQEQQEVGIITENGKSYIGPYILSLNNGCKIGKITIDGKEIVEGISTDRKAVKSVDNIKNNKAFYIVTSENVDEIKNINVTAQSSISYMKSRMVLVGNSPSQNFLVWRSEEKTKTPEEELPVPKFGKLEIEKVDEFKNSNLNLENIGFKLYSSKNQNWLKVTNGKITFVDFDKADEFKTNKNGKVPTIENLPLGRYIVYETSIPTSLQQYYTLPKEKPVYVNDSPFIYITSGSTVKITAKNNRDFTDFYIIKRDEDTRAALSGIEFVLYSIKDQGFVTFGTNNIVTSTNAKYDKASKLITVNGKTQTITKLPVGEYMVLETSVGPNTQYTIGSYRMPDGGLITAKKIDQVEVKANSTGVTYIEETNKQEYINISGIVWEDVKTGKNTQKNDNLLGDSDYKINGIEVRLIDKTTGNVVRSDEGAEQKVTTKYDSKTKQNGYYKFEKVKISELANYYIEFTYDGITYQSVVTPDGITNDVTTSKAQEQNRKAFNDMFTKITGEGQTINGVKLSYNKESDNGYSIVTLNNISDRTKGLDVNNKLVTLTKQGDFTITSKTADNFLSTRYNSLKRTAGNTSITEITNVNLGLYEREKPDLALSKDISNAEISINGKTYQYQYGKKEEAVEKDIAENVQTALGVMFKNKNPLSEEFAYSLPIYKADAVYEDENKSNELQVSLTYKIGLINNSSKLNAKVNALKEMYSKDLEIEEVYTKNEDGTKNELYNSVTSSNVGNYKQASLDVNVQVAAGKTEYVYIKFKLPTEKIRDIVNNNLFGDEEFENHAEITSYTVYEDSAFNNTYAGFDTNSIPNNYDITKIDETDENDSDNAPGIKVVDAGERKITGIVFEDNDKDESDNERIGDGLYTEGENKVQKAIVSLVDSNNNVYGTTESNENGEYTISGFIPGDYKLQFTWGEGVNTTINENPVTVDKYKSTIWTEANRKEKEDAKWYLNTDIRYSDALDDYSLRQELDKITSNNLIEMLNSDNKDAKMVSSTKTLDIGVELKDYEETLVNDKLVYTFNIENVDFGIIERPAQSISIEKNVDSIKLTSGDGAVLVDAKVNEQGILEGEVKGVKGDLGKGFISIEVDTDLLPGGNAQVGYKIKLKNTSEKDYLTEDYYLYGIPGEEEQVTLTVQNIYDYLRGLQPTVTTNTEWEVVENAELQNKLGITAIDKLVANSIANQNENANNNTYTINEKTANIIANWIVEYNRQNKTSSIEDLQDISSADYLNAIRSIKCKDATTSVNKETAFDLKAGEEKEYDFYSDIILASTDDLVFENDVEIGNVIANSDIGRTISIEKSNLYNTAQRITITPPTGEDKDFTPIIIISIFAIAILGAGIVVIKKTVLKK